MKKIAKTLLVAGLTLSLAVPFVACGGNKVSVTAVSSDSYTDVEKAVKGYLDKEISYSYERGEGANKKTTVVSRADYVSHESKETMKASKLKLTDEQKKGLVSAETVSVKANYVIDPGDEEMKSDITQTVYVLKYGDNDFKYAIPEPIVGERATNTYMNKIADVALYKNSSLEMIEKQTDEETNALAFGGATVAELGATAIRVVGYSDEARFNAKAPGHGDLTSDPDDADEESYIVAKDGVLYSVSSAYSDSREWSVYPYGISETSVDGAKEFLIGEMFESLYMGGAAAYEFKETGIVFSFSVKDSNNDTCSTEISAVISEEKIASLIYKYTETSEDGSDSATNEQSLRFSFDPVTVTVPAEVTAAVDAYIAAQA